MSKKFTTREDLLRQLEIQVRYLENTTKRLCLLKGFKTIGYSFPTSITIDKSEFDKDDKYIKSYNDYQYTIELAEILPNYKETIKEYIDKDYKNTLKHNKEARESMKRFLDEAFKNLDTLK